MSVPSIVSNAGGLPETVTRNSGWIFEAGSRMELYNALEEAHAAASRDALRDMGANARKHCEKHWDLRVQSELTLDALVNAQHDRH